MALAGLGSLGPVGCASKGVATEGLPVSTATTTSRVYLEYTQALRAHRPLPIPDFGFAGYRQSEVPVPTVEGPIARVDDFGAKADDEVSDLEGIERAARHLERGGVILFGPGTYLLDPDVGPDRPLVISGSHIVLRGAGRSKTKLLARRPLPPADELKLGSAPFRIQLGARFAPEPAVLAKLTSGVRKGSKTLTVDDTSRLSAGEWVRLSASGRPLADRLIAPYRIHASWKLAFAAGFEISELHRIAEVEGGLVSFETPVHLELKASDRARLEVYSPVEEVGVEDLTLAGAWAGPFEHHANALGDGGFSALELSGIVDGWVRRVAIENVNRGIRVTGSAQLTLSSIEFSGAPGHVSVIVKRSTNVRVGPGRDLARHYHGPAVSDGAAGTVYWRYRYDESAAFDGHGNGPYATLLDRVEGGLAAGRSGGDLASRPNHLADFVLWNFRYLGPAREVDFWRKDIRATDRFVLPLVVGLDAPELELVKSKVAVIERGHTEPPSLFEAQLGERLGRSSDVLSAEIADWQRFQVE